MLQAPEQRARERIDAMLAACGLTVQDKSSINLSATRGVAICELTFATGEPDYTLFVDGKTIGTVEAKPVGITLAEPAGARWRRVGDALPARARIARQTHLSSVT